MRTMFRKDRPRCAIGIRMDSLASRCLKQKAHDGGHEAKGLERFPYQRLKWFAGDRREFITSKDNEFAWYIH